MNTLERIEEITSWPGDNIEGETDNPLTMLMMIHDLIPQAKKEKTIYLIPAWECPACFKIIETLPHSIFEIIHDGAKWQCPKCKTNISLNLHTHSSDEGDWSRNANPR